MTTAATMTAEIPPAQPTILHIVTAGPLSTHADKATRDEAAQAAPFTFAPAPKPTAAPKVGRIPFDETRPENGFSLTSLQRGQNLLSEGYSVSLWGLPDPRTGMMRFCVETPKGHRDPYYFAEFDGYGGASCECARCGLGGKLCCHVAAILSLAERFPGFVSAAMRGNALIVLQRWEQGFRSRVFIGAEEVL